MLEQNLEPTIENLQRVSRISKHCGTRSTFVQKFSATREPDRKKLEIGLELAKEIYLAINNDSEEID